MAEISIIIVNYKTDKLTRECVASIKRYPPEVPFEIVVIDNSKDNVGFAAGANKGIRKASGKYVLLLNSDTKVKEGSIDRLYGFAKSHPDAGAVASRLLNWDGSVQASCYRFPTLGRTIRQYWFGEKGLLDKYIPETQTVDEAVMASYLITPKCLKEVGMLDERYFFYFEDFDYARRIKNAGLKIYYVPTSEVFHLHGASGRKLANELNQWKRLIPGSKLFHGVLLHYLITFVIWSSQKWKKLFQQS